MRDRSLLKNWFFPSAFLVGGVFTSGFLQPIRLLSELDVSIKVRFWPDASAVRCNNNCLPTDVWPLLVEHTGLN